MKLAHLIDRMFSFDLRQTPPEQTEDGENYLAAMIDSWDKHLTRKRVPTERFEELYEEAVNVYDHRGPFNIFTLLSTWDRIKATERHPTAVQCNLIDEHDEETMVVIYFYKLGVERLMPCPNCRPDAFTQKQNELIAMLLEQRANESVEV